MNKVQCLLTVVLAATSVVSAQPTFFSESSACLSAAPGTFNYYKSVGITRLEYWKARVVAGTARLAQIDKDLCANERTVDVALRPGEREAFRNVRLEAGHWVFFVGETPVADADCGNDFTWAQFVLIVITEPPPAPQPEPEPEPEPPPPPQDLRPVPPDYVPVVEDCPKCVKVVISNLDKKGKLLKFSAQFDKDVYVSGKWVMDSGKVIGIGNDLLISYERLEKLFGKKKGEHTIRFIGRDAHDDEVSCKGTIVIKKHGRHWLFKFPGLNCLYAWTADIANWSLGGTVEKLSCAAAGVGAYFYLAEDGVVKAAIAVVRR